MASIDAVGNVIVSIDAVGTVRATDRAGRSVTMTTRRFALRLRRVRADRKMSQVDLAKASGVSREYIARLELAQQDPTLGTMQKLAKALKVTVGKLVE